MLTIRLARIDEIPALWELRNRAAWAGCASSYSNEQLSLWLAGPLPDRFSGLVVDGTAFVAQDGEDLLGYGALNIGANEVEAVFVDPTAEVRREDYELASGVVLESVLMRKELSTAV